MSAMPSTPSYSLSRLQPSLLRWDIRSWSWYTLIPKGYVVAIPEQQYASLDYTSRKLIRHKLSGSTIDTIFYLWFNEVLIPSSMYGNITPEVHSLVPRLSRNANCTGLVSFFFYVHNVIKIGLKRKGVVLRIVQLLV